MEDDSHDRPHATETFTCDDVDVVRKDRVFDGYFKVDRYHVRHRRHEGGWTEVMPREIFERGHATAVLLYDPDLETLVFIEQFRAGAYAAFNSPWFDKATHTPWMLECVAGIIDEGESPEDVARRESLEEANCVVDALEFIAHYLVSPGGTSESLFLYCGRTDAANAGGIHGVEEEHENIRVLSVPVDKALAWLDEPGRYDNSMTLIAMQWFKLNHARIREKWARA